MKLTEHQEIYKNNLYKNWIQKESSLEYLFVAPTGSGKTFLIFNLIKELFENLNSNQKIIVIYQTLSKGSLAYQTIHKFKKYQEEANAIFNLYHINAPSDTKSNVSKIGDSTYHIPLQNKTLYVIGSQTITDSSTLKTRSYWPKFLTKLKIQNYKVYFIWDEAHIGAGKSQLNKSHIHNSLQQEINKNVLKKLYLTATPKQKEPKFEQLYRKHKYIEFKESDAEEDMLLKKTIIAKDYTWMDEASLLKKAINDFKEVQEEYKESTIQVRPAMLIQIINCKKGFEEEHADYLNKLKKTLEKENLKWFCWLSDNKTQTKKIRTNKSETEKNLSNPRSEVDVIIFKQAVTEGWDIPRACMLLRLRNVKSSTLKKQTLGRIRRNPIPKPLPLKEIKKYNFAQKYYVYTNQTKDLTDFMFVDIKPDFKQEKFHFLELEKNEKSIIKQEVNNYLTENKKIIKSKCLNYINQFKKPFSHQTISFYKQPRSKQKKEINLLTILSYFYQIYSTKFIQKILSSFYKTKINTLEIKVPTWTYHLFWIDKENEDHIKNLKKIINNKTQKELIYKDYRLTSDLSPTLPKKATLFNKDKAKVTIKKSYESFFPYEIKSINKTKNKTFYVDSHTEESFINNLFKTLYELSKTQKTFEIKIGTKHFLPSKIFFEYIMIDEINNIWPYTAKSHPDVLLRIKKEAITYTFIIEIKDLRYPDLAKNSSLKEAYQKCSLALKEKNYIFALCEYNISIEQPGKHYNKSHQFHIYKNGNESKFHSIRDLINIIDIN